MSERRRDSSFEEFVATCSTRLMRSAYLLCGDRQLAEDLLQVTMMRTARRWAVACRAPEAYARRVLLNAARDHARRRRRRVGEVLSDATAPIPGEPRAGADHADAVAGRDEVLEALAALPQRQREVIVLRFYGELSVAETAEAIGASDGTVMSYTSRALTRLRGLLGEGLEDAQGSANSEVEHGHR
jgi:RNA polymerase sigma-70 factor (sigma-E family)